MQIFSVTLGNKEFSVVGVADVVNKTANFQGMINGIPFVQDEDYQLVRQIIFDAFELNQPEKNAKAN